MNRFSDSIPTAPNASPLLGHLVPLIRRPFAFLTSLPAHGDLVRIRLGPANIVIACDPELTRQILLDDRTFDKGGLMFDRAREWLGDGLGTCPHSRHRRKRRLAQPAFRHARMPVYAHAMVTHTASVVDNWSTGQVLDIYSEMMTITSTTFGTAMFHTDLPHCVLRQTLVDLTTLIAGTTRRMVMPAALTRLPTPGNRRFSRANTRLRQTLSGIIAERRASGADHGDLLSALIIADSPDSNDQALSDTELIDAAVTFFGGGTDSTAATLAWALYLVATHPDVRERLHVEVDKVLAGRRPEYTDLDRLELTGRIVTETLRQYPPESLFTRSVTTDTELGGHVLSAGTTIAYSPYLIHHLPDLYEDPNRFDPDRWLTGRTKPPPSGFIPFSAGARKCIGDSFGTNEATLALATIAARWCLQPIPRLRVRPTLSVPTKPAGLRLRVIDRART
ncbi:cytochrome P450 [Nocardia wallacei]|uniref:cytochrome P450 n=1 Tax=Nocardia wallacei TaxID=480035 RepID=UPI0024540AA9|nr:cytochrome P450 [Nocardia wallacei]